VSAALSHIVLGTNCMAEAEGFYMPLLTMLGWRRRFSDASPDKLLWQQMYTLPLYQKPELLAYSNNISGVQPNPPSAHFVPHELMILKAWIRSSKPVTTMAWPL